MKKTKSGFLTHANKTFPQYWEEYRAAFGLHLLIGFPTVTFCDVGKPRGEELPITLSTSEGIPLRGSYRFWDGNPLATFDSGNNERNSECAFFVYHLSRLLLDNGYSLYVWENLPD